MHYHNIIIYIWLLCIFNSCGHDKNKGDRTVFRYNEIDGITSLDPLYTRNLSNINGCNQIYNGLVQYDSAMNIIPCIAKSWTIDSKATTYTFILRNDVYFHESQLFGSKKTRKVNADDFVYSLNRIIDPTWASPGSWIMSNVARQTNKPLQKEDNYTLTKPNLSESNNISNSSEKLALYAPNDSTLIIKLNQPYSPFLSILAMKYCSVIPKEIVEYYGKDFRNHPIGTGPFVFKYWKEDEKLILVKNNNYFEKDSEGNRYPYLDAVAISFIKDRQTVFLEFVKDNFDYMSGIAPAYMNEFLTADGELNPKYNDRFKLLSEAYLNTEYIGFNLEDESSPLSDTKVRQAINYAIDKKKMLRHLRANIGEPGCNGFIPIGLLGHLNYITYDYNIDKAKDLIKQSKYYDNGNFPEINIATTMESSDLCNYIQNKLTNIGIPTKIDVYSPAVIKDMRATSKLQCFRGSWIADYPDAENYMSVFYSKNFCPAGPNYCHWKNSEFDKMYEQSLKETDAIKRTALYSSMDSLLMTDPPIVVLFYDRVLRFINKRVTGLGSNPVNLVELKKVKMID